MAKKWIQKAIEHPGAFTRKAKAAGGRSAAAFQAKVLANPELYNPQTVRQANLRKTLVKITHKRGRRA